MTAIESAVVVTSSNWIGDDSDRVARPLTTTFTYDPGCLTTRWQLSADSSTDQNLISFTSATQCNPLGTNDYFSPGICPEGMTIATVIENRHSNYTKGGSRLWYANCCSSYVTPKIYALGKKIPINKQKKRHDTLLLNINDRPAMLANN
jgi:hypothetical protein